MGSLPRGSAGEPVGDRLRRRAWVLVRVGAAGPTGSALGPRIKRFGHRGGGPLTLLYHGEAIVLGEDLLDIGHDVLVHHGEGPGVGADPFVLADGDGDQAVALRLATLAHHANVTVRGRTVSLLDPFVDLPGDRFVASDAFLSARHGRNPTTPSRAMRGPLAHEGHCSGFHWVRRRRASLSVGERGVDPRHVFPFGM